MSLETILDTLPECANDLKLNFSSLKTNHADLSEQQFWGSVYAAALASRNKAFLKVIQTETQTLLNEEAIKAVNAAASIMAMNNIYYRFTDLIENETYRAMPAGLRMNKMREIKPEMKIDFEMWALVVSTINGCSMCVTAHEKQLIKSGIKAESVQLLAKISAVIHALAFVADMQN